MGIVRRLRQSVPGIPQTGFAGAYMLEVLRSFRFAVTCEEKRSPAEHLRVSTEPLLFIHKVN